MLRERLSGFRRIMCYGIGLVCLCLVMYVLGNTMTLWTMEFPLDQTDSPLLEGLSLPTILSDLIPRPSVTPAGENSLTALKQLSEHGLLRPPITTA
jgi:hypothetical protein